MLGCEVVKTSALEKKGLKELVEKAISLKGHTQIVKYHGEVVDTNDVKAVEEADRKRFAYVDILQNPDIRAELPKYANWPTFPQLWVDGELVGGCDIVIEMYQRGELQQLIKETAAKYKSEEPDAE